MPRVTGMERLAVALARTAEFVCEAATAINDSEPGTAKLTGPVLMETICEAPAASVTEVVASLATRPPGPVTDRSNVSCTLPVLVIVICNVVPGVAEDGVSLTLTPSGRTVRLA